MPHAYRIQLKITQLNNIGAKLLCETHHTIAYKYLRKFKAQWLPKLPKLMRTHLIWKLYVREAPVFLSMHCFNFIF